VNAQCRRTRPLIDHCAPVQSAAPSASSRFGRGHHLRLVGPIRASEQFALTAFPGITGIVPFVSESSRHGCRGASRSSAAPHRTVTLEAVVGQYRRMSLANRFCRPQAANERQNQTGSTEPECAETIHRRCAVSAETTRMTSRGRTTTLRLSQGTSTRKEAGPHVGSGTAPHPVRNSLGLATVINGSGPSQPQCGSTSRVKAMPCHVPLDTIGLRPAGPLPPLRDSRSRRRPAQLDRDVVPCRVDSRLESARCAIQ